MVVSAACMQHHKKSLGVPAELLEKYVMACCFGLWEILYVFFLASEVEWQVMTLGRLDMINSSQWPQLL